MTMASVTVRVDADTNAMHPRSSRTWVLDLSCMTRASRRQIVRERRIPWTCHPTPLPIETAEAPDEARRITTAGKARFNTADNMCAALDV